MELARHLDGNWQAEFAMPEGEYAKVAEEIAPVNTIPSREFSRDFTILWSFLASWISTNESLRSLVREREISILHATSLKAMVFAWLIGLKSRCPVIWHHHDILPVTFSNHMWLRFIALGATKIVVVSDAAKDALVHAGIPAKKISVVRNGLNPEDWPMRDNKRESGKFQIGYVGELSPRKGLDWLPSILQAIEKKHGENYHCTIVGEALSDPEFGVRIRRELKAWIDLGKVEFVGRQENISEWMQKFDVVLVPSRQDPFPTVIMEANFSGAPVIARPKGGIPEMIQDGESGYLCDSKDGFIEKLTHLIEDRAALEAMSRQAREFALQEFTIKRMSEKFRSIYEEIIQTQR